MKLTDDQQSIVNYIDGSILVTAGPGSGKTRVLTQRIINILKHRRGRVLALTFSNKAADEIQERVKNELPDEDHSRVKVETIHSFCLDLVVNKGNQIGLPSGLSVIEQTNDKINILKRSFNHSNVEIPTERNLREVLQKIQKLKQIFSYPESEFNEEQELEQDFKVIFETYHNLLIANRMIDFDDILYYAHKILVENPKVQKNYTRLYKYILIDEAQDLNDTQYRILKALTINFDNIMMVGDESQSIYGFNGSNSEIMTKRFVEEFKPKPFTLSENFRSTYKIIDAAMKIKPQAKSESVYPLAGEFEINSFKNESDEAEWITNKISDLIKNGSEWVEEPIKLEDIAIIGRNRYIFKKIEEYLSKKNIEYSFGSSNSNVESETLEMKIFELGIRIIVNAYDDLHYQQLNAFLNRSNKKEDYLNDILVNKEVNTDKVNHSIFLSIVEAWNVIYSNEDDFKKGLEIIRDQLSKELDNEFLFLIQEDINLWMHRWKRYIKKSVKGNRNLSYFRNQVSLGKLNNDSTTGVSLLTVHMSKGLEYQIVFIAGLNEGTFPDYRAKSSSQQKEELNNMFVAITRAKRECYLSYPEYKIMPWGESKKQRQSRYIDLLTN